MKKRKTEMEHQLKFFEDEIRDGFYVPTVIKQAWAAELDVLAEIDRICEKYGITYFADWGTFLGAVRHGGFIPWDDDLDICMKREDYRRFREVADRELPQHFRIHDYERKENHWHFVTRVVGNERISFEEEHLTRCYNFPWLACVDIFLLDYLYRDEEKEKQRDEEVLTLIALADGIREGSFSEQTVRGKLSELERTYGISLLGMSDRTKLSVELYRLAEQQMARTRPEEADRIGQIFPWVLKGAKGQPKEYFEHAVRLPFEDTTIAVAAAYHRFLTDRYGDYHRIYKEWNGHDYPFFEKQKAEIERLNGAPLPGFVFSADMLKRPAVQRTESLREIAAECFAALLTYCKDMETISPEGQSDRLPSILAQMQELAVDLGNLIEQVRGQDDPLTKELIGRLEVYCEDIWNCSVSVRSGSLEESVAVLGSRTRELEEVFRARLIKRREVLFLTTGEAGFRGLKEFYLRESSRADTDASVVFLPRFSKDPYGAIRFAQHAIDDKADGFSMDLTFADWRNYSLSAHCPDLIYFDDPYDAQNPFLSVPGDYYSRNLRLFCNQLIYIPLSGMNDFTQKEEKDQYTLRQLLCTPGVVYADRVIVGTENLREQFVECLTGAAEGVCAGAAGGTGSQ